MASWSDGEWAPVGAGIDGPVYALSSYGGRLLAAGEFGEAGGNISSHIASWDGHVWSSLGSGLDGPAFALAKAEHGLFVGGTFTIAGDRPSHYIARWDGPLPSGICESRGLGELDVILQLQDIWPNPTAETTRIKYLLKHGGDVVLTVHDLSGRRVASMFDGFQHDGWHVASWDGLDSFGRPVPTGVYLLRAKSGLISRTKQLVLIR